VIGDYSDSLGVLSRSVHNLASRKRASSDADYNIDFVVHGYLAFFLILQKIFIHLSISAIGGVNVVYLLVFTFLLKSYIFKFFHINSALLAVM